DEHGRELSYLLRAPPSDPEITVPGRLLPDFDNILLGHADRTRILPPGKHLGMFSSNGVMQGSDLIDGFVRAMWLPAKSALVITPFEQPIPKAERLAVVDAALRLADFLI